MKIIIVGAGFAGCSAAIEAKKMGASVTLIERTDMILGTGNVGGIMRNNGRFTAEEEMKEMGGYELFDLISLIYLHDNVDFPGHKHASLFDVREINKTILDYLKEIGVEIKFKTRISKVNMNNKKIISVIDDNGIEYFADAFIDSTGTAGPINNCMKHGNGCAMCILRCPTFKGRVSLTSLCGIKEYNRIKKDSTVGSMSGSIEVLKESLSYDIINEINKKGVCMINVPEKLIEDHLNIKACQQYSLEEFKNNLILLNTGYVKIMTPYNNLENLKKIKGLENLKLIDPYSGGIGNSMRSFEIPKIDKTLKVKGIDNLFCAGEKVGMLVGHTEAIITGIISAYNCIKYLNKENLIILPKESIIGEAIDYILELQNNNVLDKNLTFSGSTLFKHLKAKGLYETNKNKINEKIKKLKLQNIF